MTPLTELIALLTVSESGNVDWEALAMCASVGWDLIKKGKAAIYEAGCLLLRR